MKIDTNAPEVKAIFKEIMEAPERMFEMFRIDMKQACERAATELIKVELTRFLDREKYQRTENTNAKGEKNYRNGNYPRSYTVKNIGTLDIQAAETAWEDLNQSL